MTTIQISDALRDELKKRKLHRKESYEEIIWDLLEDQMVLKDEVVKRINESIEEYKRGQYLTEEEVFDV